MKKFTIFKTRIINNVLYNKPYADKLPSGAELSVVAFIVENKEKVFKESNVFVGIELESGFLYVEGSRLLLDELYVFRGLDENDIQNYFCVGEYIYCLNKFGLLESVLG